MLPICNGVVFQSPCLPLTLALSRDATVQSMWTHLPAEPMTSAAEYMLLKHRNKVLIVVITLYQMQVLVSLG